MRGTIFILISVAGLLSFVLGAGDDHEDEHFCLKPGEVFRGHRHYTLEGETCLYWSQVWTQGASAFPDATLQAAENNCRDPDNTGTPWCYIASNPLKKGMCDIPKCNQRDAVIMTPAECKQTWPRAGYNNGDIILIYSDKYDSKNMNMSYPGCSIRFEACSTCKFHVTVKTELPECGLPPEGKTCRQNCQTLAIRDGLYNSTVAEIYSGSVTGPSFHTVSNALVVDYCQLVNVHIQRPARYEITAYVTSKHIHQTAMSGEIQSPNFPHGYYSEKESYIYSIDPPPAQMDYNITLIFYDWDLNGSAGSTLMVKWSEKMHNGSSQAISRKFVSTDHRPTLFIAASSFVLVFETGRVNSPRAHHETGFTAKYRHVNKPDWPERPDTNCGGALSRSASVGGSLTYRRLYDSPVNKYFDCIWIIPRPKGYTQLRYTVSSFSADAGVSLVIRDGVTSHGRQISNGMSVVSGSGLFIHVSGHMTGKNVDLNITYLATVRAYGRECRSDYRVLMFYCRLLDLCIDQELYPTHANTVCGINMKPGPISCPVYTCNDGLKCYDEVMKCNMFKDCDDGSDEALELCYAVPTPASVNIPLAVTLPLVGVLFLIPIIVIIVYIVRQHIQEQKDEDLQASKKELMKGGTVGDRSSGGSAVGSHQGLDNLGLQLDDIPLSVIDRSRPTSRYASQDLNAPPSRYASQDLNAPPGPDRRPGLQSAPKKPNPKFAEIQADIHLAKSPYSPRSPGETQSMRVDGPPDREPRTRSQRFDLPPDIDRIEEVPEQPRQPHQTRQPPRSTLANYQHDERPYGEPEGRSYRDPVSYREPSYRDYNRQPGDGSYLPASPMGGAKPKLYEPREQRQKLGQYRPDRDVPGRGDKPRPQMTQSYRTEPEPYNAPPRQSRSYRFQDDAATTNSSTEV